MTAYKLTAGNRGSVNILLVPFLFLLLFFVAAAGFGLWAYNGMQDYKNNVNQKIDAAVRVAKQQEDIIKDKQHAEADKSPLKTYTGPEQYGSIQVSYPKTWSAYVVAGGAGSQPLDGYFQPGVVPDISDQKSTFALRVEVLNQSYSSTLEQYNQMVTDKTLTASPYSFPHVPSVVGIRYDGAFEQGKQISGSIIIMPLRDKTLQVFTESPTYAQDFNNYILPNLAFSP